MVLPPTSSRVLSDAALGSCRTYHHSGLGRRCSSDDHHGNHGHCDDARHNSVPGRLDSRHYGSCAGGGGPLGDDGRHHRKCQDSQIVHRLCDVHPRGSRCVVRRRSDAVRCRSCLSVVPRLVADRAPMAVAADVAAAASGFAAVAAAAYPRHRGYHRGHRHLQSRVEWKWTSWAPLERY